MSLSMWYVHGGSGTQYMLTLSLTVLRVRPNAPDIAAFSLNMFHVTYSWIDEAEEIRLREEACVLFWFA